MAILFSGKKGNLFCSWFKNIGGAQKLALPVLQNDSKSVMIRETLNKSDGDGKAE